MVEVNSKFLRKLIQDYIGIKMQISLETLLVKSIKGQLENSFHGVN